MNLNFAVKFVVVVLTPFLLLAVFADGDGDTGGEAPAEAPEEAASTAKEAGWGAQEVTLDRRDDGHFYAEAMVEGTPVQFLVDTGASTIALTGRDAEAIGIYWSEDDIVPVARGAGGMVHGVQVTLNDVRVGDFEAHGIEAAVIPEGLPISLLGQSFLRQVPDVAIQGDMMVLRN